SVDVVQDDLLLAQTRQVIRPLAGARRDRAEAVLEQRDLQAGVREDTSSMSLDDPDRLEVRIPYGPACEDPHGNPRGRALHTVGDLAHFVICQLRRSERN